MVGGYTPLLATEIALAERERDELLAEQAEEAGFDDPNEYLEALLEDAAEARMEAAREDRWDW